MSLRGAKRCPKPPDFPGPSQDGARREPLRPPAHPCGWTPIVARALVGDDEACFTVAPADPAAPSAPIVFTAEELRQLPINAGTLTMQPAQDWVLVNIETIAFTDAEPQTFDTVVAGTPVTVHVEPERYIWDFDSGRTFTTKHPGRPYPEHTVYHVYEWATTPGQTHTISLTTVWVAWFSVAGGPWQPVNGLATTTLTTDPFTVITARTYLTDGVS